jgi:DNA-binding response OmpR family regulator
MPKIVLAEDDQTMVTLLTTLLRMDGFEVSSLDADEDVAAAVLRDRPDVLVLDFHLSSQSGLDVMDAISRSEAFGHTRVLMISGMDVRDQCIQHGADDFLLKPFMPDELIDLLRKDRQAN